MLGACRQIIELTFKNYEFIIAADVIGGDYFFELLLATILGHYC